MGMPKYGPSREMSQSASALSPVPSSHSRALLATSGCNRSPSAHSRRNATARGSERRKKKCSDGLSTGVAPVSEEYGFFRSVGALSVLHFSHASPYWSFAPQIGHSPLM